MTQSLESPFLQFTLNPENSSWSLNHSKLDGPSLEQVWMRVSYRQGLSALFRTGKRKYQYLERWRDARVSEGQTISSCHGPIRRFVVEMGPDANGIHYRLKFHLSMEHPLFFWRLIMENHGRRPIEVEKIEMLRAGFFPKRRLLPAPGPLSALYQTKPVGYGAVRPSQHPGEMGFFCNGWQSWSYSGAYSAQDCHQSSRLGPFAGQMWYASGKAPQKRPGFFNSDMFGVIGDRTNRSGILVGYLSQKTHFGSLDAFIADRFYPALRLSSDGDRARLDPGAQLTTDWAVIQFVDLDDPDPLAPYLDAVARQNRLPPAPSTQPSPVGWCSWYQFFRDIDEKKLIANLESVESLQESIPFSLFQLDDGFEEKVGDWHDFSPGFPRGVAPLAEEIRSAGFTPGLWLAPFILHSRSKMARVHRRWLTRNPFGLPVNAGFLWNNFTRALDLTCPGAMEHVSDLIRTAVDDWGYEYLKLDFLYAAALKGRYHDRTKTRAQILRHALEGIREAAGPGTFLLGCGVPLGSSIGIFDAVRIGADVDPHWEPHLFPPRAFFQHEPNMPSTRNALQNIFSRSAFHRRWWINDPDCLMLRADSSLTLAEVQTLATAIAMMGGSLLISDDLPRLSADRLRVVERLLPLIDQRPRVLDWFDSKTPGLVRLDLQNQTGKWHLLAVFNWLSHQRDLVAPLSAFHLPTEAYFLREFWSGDVCQISDGHINLPGIPAHGVKLVALTPISQSRDQNGNEIPCYLGGDLHISQGLEVAEWSVSAQGNLKMRLERPGKTQGYFDLFLPSAPGRVSMDGGEIQWQKEEQDIYRFQVRLNQSAFIEIA